MSASPSAITDSDFPNRHALESLAERYHLAMPERQRTSRMGELSGRRTGSSVEYQDRKDFAPGDDLRHVDWRGFARSDRMTVKLYREEITPAVDLFIDVSASMHVTGEKRLRSLELAYLFFLLSRNLHAVVRVHAMGSKMFQIESPLELPRLCSERIDSPLPLLRGSPAARRGGIKVLISDLLFPFSPPELTRSFSGADRLLIVQTLSAFEDNPGEGLAAGSLLRLEDAEADQHLDVRLDAKTVEGYLGRLNSLRNDLTQRMRQEEGCFASVREDEPLDATMRKLLNVGMLTI